MKIKIQFTLNVDIQEYMDEFGLDSVSEARELIKQDVENAGRTTLENEHYNFLEAD